MIIVHVHPEHLDFQVENVPLHLTCIFLNLADNRDLHFSPMCKEGPMSVDTGTGTVDSTPKQVCTHTIHGLWSNEKIISIVD